MRRVEQPTIRRRARRIEAEWVIDSTHRAVLSVYHSDRKCFVASMRQEKDMGDGCWQWEPFNTDLNATIGHEPVARYSDRALGAYFDLVLSELQSAGPAERFPVIFNPPVESEAA